VRLEITAEGNTAEVETEGMPVVVSEHQPTALPLSNLLKNVYELTPRASFQGPKSFEGK
jgi:hypothetical protein